MEGERRERDRKGEDGVGKGREEEGLEGGGRGGRGREEEEGLEGGGGGGRRQGEVGREGRMLYGSHKINNALFVNP